MENCECGNKLKKDHNEKIVGCYALRHCEYVLWCDKSGCFKCYPVESDIVTLIKDVNDIKTGIK